MAYVEGLGSGRQQIGWRSALSSPRGPAEHQLWAIGAMGESAAKAAIRELCGVTVLAIRPEFGVVSDEMRQAAGAGRDWHVLTILVGEVSAADMQEARRIYPILFNAVVQPYTADRFGPSQAALFAELEALHVAPGKYSSSDLWFPELLAPTAD